eukprot:gene28713-31882_t
MGVEIEVMSPGNGQMPRAGQTVTVHYTGMLTNGKVFDSSVQKNRPFSFGLGAGQVIKAIRLMPSGVLGCLPSISVANADSISLASRVPAVTPWVLPST